MATPTHRATGNVKVTLNYALPDPTGKALSLTQLPSIPTTFRTNIVKDPRKGISVLDLRSQLDTFSLDNHGFEYRTHHTQEDFRSKESIDRYYTEMESMIKQHTGVADVVVFGHTIRKNHETVDFVPESNALVEDLGAASWYLVHGHGTKQPIAEIVKKHRPNDVERLLRDRIRHINAWRPISLQVHHDPLAVAAWQTPRDGDRLPLRVETIGTTPDQKVISNQFLSRFDERHQWFYLGHQSDSEVTLIKCSDTRPGEGAEFCFHSTLSLRCDVNPPRRLSIDVDALVFGDPVS